MKYALPCGIDTSRPRYLAYVLIECLKPGSPFREVAADWLVVAAAALCLPLNRVDAEWAVKTHSEYLRRRAEEPAE